MHQILFKAFVWKQLDNWYFVILLSQNGFKCDQETKFQTMNHFIKSVLKKTYTNVLQNICS